MKTKDQLATEISTFITSSNYDLHIAEDEEQFDQCKLIQAAILLQLQSFAEEMVPFTRYTASELFQALVEENKRIFQLMKEEKERHR